MSERFTLENPNLGMNRKTSGRIGLRRLRNDSAIIGHDRVKTVDRAMSFELSNVLIRLLSNSRVNWCVRFIDFLKNCELCIFLEYC